MPSKNSKAAAKAAINELPCLPLTLTFISEKQPIVVRQADGTYAETKMIGDIHVDTLPKEVTHTLKVTRLKGFQYTPEFQKLLKFPGAEAYKSKGVFVTTEKTEKPVKATLSGLTNGVTLLSWMLNNGPKLYLNAVETKLKNSFQDRNYSEIVGALISKTPETAKGSVAKTKYVKEDIVIISTANAVEQTEEYENESPLHSYRNALMSLPGMETKVKAFLASEKERKANNKKSIGYKF